MDVEDFLKVAIDAAKNAGKVTLKYFRKKLIVHEKEARELVTNVDMESEKIILNTIKNAFPDHTILSEELGKSAGEKEYLWIVDPLDGTHNYVHGQPAYGISIALVYKNEVILGVIYLPFYDELFHAVKNRGAFLNVDKKISVSAVDSLSNAYVLYDPQLHKRPDMFDNLRRLYQKCFTIRIIGSAVHDASAVASGRAEARIWHKTKTVDVAAGTLLVREAGGKATDFSGRPYRVGMTEVLVSNGKIHDKLIQILSGN